MSILRRVKSDGFSQECGLIRRRTHRWLATLASLVALLLALCGPAATWLQAPDRRPETASRVDVVYMLAGERDQLRRAEAVAGFLSGYGAVSAEQPLVLTGNDRAVGPWSREEDRSLAVGEWAVRRLNTLGVKGQVVPGLFTGTDGEMEALANYLRERPRLVRILLVSSPFHMRRAILRFERYAPDGIRVYGLPAPSEWSDRLPWVVATELLKILRDSVGMSRAPLLSRQGWARGCGRGPRTAED